VKSTEVVKRLEDEFRNRNSLDRHKPGSHRPLHLAGCARVRLSPDCGDWGQVAGAPRSITPPSQWSGIFSVDVDSGGD